MRGLSGHGPVVLKARNQLRMAVYPTYGPQAYLLELELYDAFRNCPTHHSSLILAFSTRSANFLISALISARNSAGVLRSSSMPISATFDM